ncbi:MAG: 3-methyl-2-oxobutanoate hydroxymethyltransferase [Gammaproteobacteria bacterium]
MSTQTSEIPNPVTAARLRKWKQRDQKFACLTAYDASFANAVDRAGVDVILVGDSLGMVIQGHQTTVPVTMDHMVYHCQLVARGCRRALLMVDMPFMSFATPAQALDNAARLMREGLAHMVKLEGGGEQSETVRQLSSRGIPVCAHIGLQPQSIHKLGGYRVQGRQEGQARIMLEDARTLEAAGAEMLVLECVPFGLARTITQALSIPVIGIGAGPHCDGQILVLHDLIGVTPGKRPRFSKDFLLETGTIQGALEAYVDAVREGRFPAMEHCFE